MLTEKSCHKKTCFFPINLSKTLNLVYNFIQADQEELKTVEQIFTPSLDSYEFLIHLKPLQVPNRSLAISRLWREGG